MSYYHFVGYHSTLLIVVMVFGILFTLLYVSEVIPPVPSTVIVIIPEGSSFYSSAHNNYEPEIAIVVIGVNNTVRWINKDVTGISIRANSVDDPAFFNATEGVSLLAPEETFDFTFNKAGVFGYHGTPRPWMQGTIIVLEPGTVDVISKGLVEQRLKEEIEGKPLTVYVGKTDDDFDRPSSNISLPVYAIQGFVFENPTSLIATYQINPSWKVDNNVSGPFESAVALKDREGKSIAHNYLNNSSTILSFDAICPATKVEIGDDGTINQIGMDTETIITYGPRVMISITNNASGIIYYEYSLGKTEPISNGFYRLTFVSPYEASVDLSDQLQIVSYEQSGCMIVGGKEGGTTLPYYDIIFKLDERSSN